MRRLDLPPDVFAVVMATGICSIAAEENGYRGLSVALGVLASVGLALLVVGLALQGSELIVRARDPDVALRLFTATAACEVLGMRWASDEVALRAGLVASVLTWLVLAPLALRDVRQRPREELRAHAHGAWLLSSVATAGLAAIIATTASGSPWPGVAVALWLVSLAIYVSVASLILWHVASRLRAGGDVPPDSWILMGALAAATLAGARIDAVPSALTDLCWVAATAWIPILLYAEAWQVNHHQGALRFRGAWWSAVFPLGMYSAATAELGLLHRAPWMGTVSLVFFWDALAVWCIVGLGWASSASARQQH